MEYIIRWSSAMRRSGRFHIRLEGRGLINSYVDSQIFIDIHHARFSSATTQRSLSNISTRSHTLHSCSSLGLTKYPQVCFLTDLLLRKASYRNPTRSYRPKTTWTIKRTILLKLLRQFIKTESQYGFNSCRCH